jgi:hypothetical protein
MNRELLGPLLRGVGTSLMLAGAVIGFAVAREDLHLARLRIQRQGGVVSSGARASGVAAGSENVTSEEGEESLAERVVENLWFEWLGFVGAAVTSSSFYFEYVARRKRGG